MAFDLKRIRKELEAAPLVSPYPWELGAAIVNDVFRAADARPVEDATWIAWRKKAHPLWEEQLGMLGHILASTSLAAESAAALDRKADAASIVEGFFASIKPLTAEMIRANAFRQEEMLRKWIARLDGAIAGERAIQSKRRLDQLDYGKALAEYERAEDARKAEAARRERKLQKAQAEETAARGWRE